MGTILVLSDHRTIFDLEPPTTDVAPPDPQGEIPNPFSFPWSKVNETKLPGGSIKIIDSTTFNVSISIAAAEVTVEPGAIRELHVSTYACSLIISVISRPLVLAVAPDTRRMDLLFVCWTFYHLQLSH